MKNTKLEKDKKVLKAYNFLNEHPALNTFWNNYFENNFYLGIIAVDDNNIGKHDILTLNDVKKYNPLLYKKKRKKALKNKQNLNELTFHYKEVFNKSWKMTKLLYHTELCFFKVKDNIPKKYTKLDFHYWYDCYLLEDVFADSYPDLLIKLERKVRKYLGSFKAEDFYTEEEKKNHKKERPFIILEQKDYAILEENPKYKYVDYHILNKRWFEQFFKNTDYYKKNFENGNSTL